MILCASCPILLFKKRFLSNFRFGILKKVCAHTKRNLHVVRAHIIFNVRLFQPQYNGKEKIMNNELSTDCRLEVCIDSVESAIASQEGGAARVELCDNLFEGGTTPSAGMIQMVRKRLDIDLYVMIRPRGGDFLYSDLEFEVMRMDISMAGKLGADGVVLGILNADGTIDKLRTATLVELARPLGVTFHRAFDMTPNPVRALKDLMDVGVDRLLTSGQEATAYEGAELIGELAKVAGRSIRIIPGGGITEKNIARIAGITGCTEFHVTGRKIKNSGMTYHKDGVYMGGELRMGEFGNLFADAGKIKGIMAKLF